MRITLRDAKQLASQILIDAERGRLEAAKDEARRSETHPVVPCPFCGNLASNKWDKRV